MLLFKSISIACSLIDSVLLLNAPYDTDCPSNTGTSAEYPYSVNPFSSIKLSEISSSESPSSKYFFRFPSTSILASVSTEILLCLFDTVFFFTSTPSLP